ncbi:hypothetical protein D9619_009425 [Psilocybe cf. subviscida]|uniref:Acyltransferase 3 domain-containing protein n=1 Tax=Psilocybe cf. subviscida TaxID=2480587 RepID=A0A8H5BUP5_9AGAR|nr:hypothetical protein D9619_009425 [Psilocybe cf. subviscida]
MPSETTPLLGSGLPGLSLPVPITNPRSVLPIKPPRTHFLDNLRGVLVFLLIFHHAAVNILQRTAFDDVEERTRRARAVLSTFIQANTQILWPTFFLVSGWAARLALEAKPDGYKFARKRVVWTSFPAMVYLVIGRWLIVKWIDVEVFVSDSSNPQWTPYAQLTGPVPYILALVILDIGHVVVRLLVRKMPTISRRDLDIVCKVVLIMAAISLVIHASALHHIHARLIPGVYYLFFPGDLPGYGAPTTFIVAYAAGANGPFLQQRVLTTRWTIAFPAALASLTFAYFPSPFLGVFRWISLFLPGPNTIYYAIVFFAVPWSILSIFTTLPALMIKWTTSWVPWAWLVAYVHTVPTIIAIHALQTSKYLTEDLILRTLLAGAVGAVITWALVAIVAKIWRWTKWIRRGGRLSMILITRRL